MSLPSCVKIHDDMMIDGSCYNHAKQKHLGCKKVRGQSEAALQIGMYDQKL